MYLKRSTLNYLILIFLILLFLIQVIFLLPSPYGDSNTFLELSFYICREDLFITSRDGESLRSSPLYPFYHHGWFYYYLLAKFNLPCSLRGIFVFNYILILITSLLSYKILNKVENNYFIKTFVLLLICLLQISLQFRPEVFTIFISVLLIYFLKKNYNFLIGILFAFLFYTQPVIMCFLGLFLLIFYYKKIIKNLIKILFGFIIFFIFLTYVYPYSLLDFIQGIYTNRGTFVAGTPYEFILKDLYLYYIIPKFIPFWGILFLIIIFNLIKKNYFFLVSLPFMIFFGPRVPMSNYVLIGLTPFLLLSQYSVLIYKDNYLNKIRKNLLLIVLFLLVVVGYTQYFARNLLTIYFFNNELKKTTLFLSNNLDKMNNIPEFGHMINQDLKLKGSGLDLSKKNYFKPEASSYVGSSKYSFNVYRVNGVPNPCPGKNIDYIDPSIYIFGHKIFNSNAGYGIWICKIN